MMTPDFIYEEEDQEGKREAYYDSLAEKVPQEFKDFDYNKLIHNRLELENFRNFLGKLSFKEVTDKSIFAIILGL